MQFFPSQKFDQEKRKNRDVSNGYHSDSVIGSEQMETLTDSENGGWLSSVSRWTQWMMNLKHSFEAMKMNNLM